MYIYAKPHKDGLSIKKLGAVLRGRCVRDQTLPDDAANDMREKVMSCFYQIIS